MFEKVYLWVHMYEYRCVRVWVCACVQTAFHAEQHATVGTVRAFAGPVISVPPADYTARLNVFQFRPSDNSALSLTEINVEI